MLITIERKPIDYRIAKDIQEIQEKNGHMNVSKAEIAYIIASHLQLERDALVSSKEAISSFLKNKADRYLRYKSQCALVLINMNETVTNLEE